MITNVLPPFFYGSQCTCVSNHIIKQVAQLPQRDRAAGWISYGQKWKTGTGRQYLQIL